VPELPPQPQPLRIKVSDITSQKLVRYAADRPQGLLCYVDELAAWIAKLSDRNTIENRSAWVQAYEAKRYEMDRVGGGSICAEVYAVSMYGNVQPQVLREASAGMGTDGLLQRFIPVHIDQSKVKRGEPEPRHRASASAWENAVRLVYALPATTYELSPEAYELFREWQLWFERTRKDHIVLQSDRSFRTALAKLEGTSGRIALVFHVLEEPFNPQVSRATMERAINVIRDYVIPMLRKSLATETTLEDWLMEWLLYHVGDRQTVTLSEIKRGAKRKLEGVGNIWAQDREVIHAMATLEEANWVQRLDDGSKEHLHKAEWAIDPSIMHRFSQERTAAIVARQRDEDERRRIAGIERRLVKGFDPATMSDLLKAS
jgi:hypothetical protein